jgi:hypothetical protein
MERGRIVVRWADLNLITKHRPGTLMAEFFSAGEKTKGDRA